jgi:hypothetical protein
LDYIKNKPFTVTKYGGRQFETKINDPQYTWVAHDYVELNGGHIVGDRYSEQEDVWITENDISKIYGYDDIVIGYKFPHGYWIIHDDDTDIPYETIAELA